MAETEVRNKKVKAPAITTHHHPVCTRSERETCLFPPLLPRVHTLHGDTRLFTRNPVSSARIRGYYRQDRNGGPEKQKIKPLPTTDHRHDGRPRRSSLRGCRRRFIIACKSTIYVTGTQSRWKPICTWYTYRLNKKNR